MPAVTAEPGDTAHGAPRRLVPSCLSDLTPEMMADLLGLAVESIEIEPIGANAGILGALARVHLSCNPPVSGPGSVIVKLPTDLPPNRAIGMAFKFYERENRFYTELADTIEIAVPHCYLSHSDPERGEFVLVLEDLAGLTQTDQATGASLDQARLAVQSVARMHSQWWDTTRTDQLDWMPWVNEPLERDQSIEIYQHGWYPFLDRFGGALTAEQIEAGALIRNRFGGVIEHLGRAPLTIAHGDYRIDNLFFAPNSSTRPVVVIDWQIAMRTRGVFDVAYFLGTSLQTSSRRRHERQLIAEYHETLTSSGVHDYSINDCWDDYRRSLMYATVYPIDAGSFDLPNELAVTMVRDWSSRFFTAVTDLDCIELLADATCS